MKTNAEYGKILSQKLKWATCAAKYCRVQAKISRDKTISMIYADIADKADAEADKIFECVMRFRQRDWEEKYGDIDMTQSEAMILQQMYEISRKRGYC